MPDDSSTEVARLLAEIGWSQRELARRLNVTESSARAWATGRREPHFTVLEWLRGVRDRMHAGPRYPHGWQQIDER
jgi:transcriptional regulator with XRE-family HTH domain